MRITGTVVSGLGQGAQFLALDWVAKEFREKLRLTPFPGTLNLRVTPKERDLLFIRRHDFIKIADPASDCPGDCPGYLTKVRLRANGSSAGAYLILPDKSQYNDVLEIIAASKLRELLGIADGDIVEIELSESQQ